MSATSAHVAAQLARAALPLVPAHGFTSHTLLVAAKSLPSTSHLTARSIDALYPSPPRVIASPGDFSVKGLAIGNGGKRSLSRPELIALARGQGTVHGSELAARDKTGPARALFKAWLDQGRREMVTSVRESGLEGELALRRGIRARLEYNETILNKLPEALALLSAPTSTPLTTPTSILPFPSPIPHLAHVSSIAQDLARASGSQSQGTAWYSLRARLALIYTLAELHLLSPPSSAISDSSPVDSVGGNRVQASVQFAEKLFRETGTVADSVQNVNDFGRWVVKSWMGIGRSLGV
ncbi:uncharacterized protein JCM15063_005222 [Sporobolomyces koalae]|uniref:uncharacterized protein n=1 Tax=Sporobolomyces koalae TaxID=500713 RepID=UPI00317241DA